MSDDQNSKQTITILPVVYRRNRNAAVESSLQMIHLLIQMTAIGDVGLVIKAEICIDINQKTQISTFINLISATARVSNSKLN